MVLDAAQPTNAIDGVGDGWRYNLKLTINISLVLQQ